MVAVGVFAGISFGSYANAATTLYDEIYDGEDGVNLADVGLTIQLVFGIILPLNNL